MVGIMDTFYVMSMSTMKILAVAAIVSLGILNSGLKRYKKDFLGGAWENGIQCIYM